MTNLDPKNAAKTLRESAKKLDALAASVAKGDDVRGDVEDVTAAVTFTLSRLYGKRPRAKHGEGAKWKMLDLLRSRPYVWVDGDELAYVARIGEWARRVRELRVEH